MGAIKIVIGIVTIALGALGLLNSIFMFIPMFVQGHAVGSSNTSRNTGLRVAGGIISAALIAGGITLLVR